MSNAVYGDFLSNFTELMRPVDFYNSLPTSNGWEEKQWVGTFAAIVLNHRFDNMQNVRVGEWSGAIDLAKQDYLYYFPNEQIKEGVFLIHPKNKILYRIVKVSDYSDEGNFMIAVIERVQGTSPDKMAIIEPIKGVY